MVKPRSNILFTTPDTRLATGFSVPLRVSPSSSSRR